MVVTRLVRISILFLFVAFFTVLAPPVPAADAQAPGHVPESVVFDCPPGPGIYPEPDPCVSTPPPPLAPLFDLPLDATGQVPEWHCDPATKQGVAVARSLLRSTYGFGGSTSRPCDATWSYEYSLHKMGLALDWSVDVTDPRGWAAGLSFIRWLLAPDDEENDFAMAKRIGVTQLIWHNRVWTSADPAWRIYCDPRDVEDEDCIRNPTLRHDDHMHISFSLEAGYLQTSFYRALGLKPIPIPPPPELPIVENDATPSKGEG